MVEVKENFNNIIVLLIFFLLLKDSDFFQIFSFYWILSLIKKYK